MTTDAAFAIAAWNRRATPPAPAPDGWVVAGLRYRFEPTSNGQWHTFTGIGWTTIILSSGVAVGLAWAVAHLGAC